MEKGWDNETSKILHVGKKANNWLKENQDKIIVDIKFSAGGFAIVY